MLAFLFFFDEIFWGDTDLVLNFLLINSIDDTKFISIPLSKNKTLAESLKCTNFSDKDDNNLINLSNQLLQLYLYMCAENKDIECCQTGRKSTIKNTYKELNIWNVGYRIGNKIKRIQKQNDKSNQDDESLLINELKKQPKRKRAHSRRGHWHHYWRGSKKTQNQYLVLKWVAPTFINYTDDIIPFVQHKVE